MTTQYTEYPESHEEKIAVENSLRERGAKRDESGDTSGAGFSGPEARGSERWTLRDGFGDVSAQWDIILPA